MCMYADNMINQLMSAYITMAACLFLCFMNFYNFVYSLPYHFIKFLPPSRINHGVFHQSRTDEMFLFLDFSRDFLVLEEGLKSAEGVIRVLGGVQLETTGCVQFFLVGSAGLNVITGIASKCGGAVG